MNEDKKRMLKELIKQLHSGASPDDVKGKFKKILENITSEDIAKIEQELVKEGMPREELRRLCDVHLAVFSEQLERQKMQIPHGHPINILMEEHKILLEQAEKLGTIASMIGQACERCDRVPIGDALTELQNIDKDFQDAETHYLREENVLFPFLEKHGITEPPAIMWMEHDHIREKKKQLHNLVEDWSNLYYKLSVNTMSFSDFKRLVDEIAKPLGEILSSHFFKENNILFPAALRVITNGEWVKIREGFDEIGYCCFTPPELTAPTQRAEEVTPTRGEILHFETGSLSKEEAEAILNTLPVDITFVDKDDVVKYFNNTEKRIFVRTKAVIGRKVQLCHPQKSIHIVNRIIEAFKTGKKDVAEFWIQMNNRPIHIRYFAVRDKNGRYLGTIEVAQDVTDIKKIEGEKRLLDWKD